MNVKEYILNDITALTLESSVKNAIDICKRLPITHVPIVENGKLIGCLSETDFQIIEDETSTISEYSHLIDFFYADENTAMLNLIKLFTNNDAVYFRYLIDSFGLGLTERSKQQLIDICGDRLDAFGIISAPSVKQLKNSVQM